MYNMSTKEIREIPANQEISSSCTSADHTKISKPSSSSKATTPWSRFKDPRIVRVSKAFGGKDRHSKVYTVRGLRDRRVRLSVPTAIQLYDLQDRLGLNQPSKVVDWLLNVAKHEIDELPPLQIPPQFLASQPAKQVLKNPRSSTMLSGDPKDAYGETNVRNEDQERLFNFGNRQNSSILPGFSNSTTYNSFPRWEPSDLSLSQPPGIHGSTAPNEDWHNLSLAPLPSTLSVPYPGFHQVLVYNQPGIIGQVPCFPSRINTATNLELDSKQPIFQNLDRLSLQNEQNKAVSFSE